MSLATHVSRAGRSVGATGSASPATKAAPALSPAAMRNRRRLVVLVVLALAAMTAYLLVDLNFASEWLLAFSMKVRLPKLAAMLIAAAAIGGASIVFQSVINNTIVTPCLLGMNSLYTLVHTALVFCLGTASAVVSNANLAFGIDLVVMAAAALLIYGHLFKLTGYNVLYVLLIGTVLSSLFGSVQSTLVRVMDPNEYDTLLTSLVASFSNVNAEIIVLAVVLLAAVALVLRRDLALLDVLTLGRDQAINLGVDYDRTVRRLLLGVTLAIAVATALVGPISFLGLIIANLSREFFKTYRHSLLAAGSALFGVITLVAGQLLVEHVFSYAVPVSVFVTVGGGAYFLFLLLFAKRV